MTNALPVGRSNSDLFEELSLLATEKSAERRRELLSSVADLFYAPTIDAHTEAERQIFADVVGRLLKDVNVAARTGFSERVAPDARTPRDVALRLANDTIDVARPVLLYSPALSDGDLVSIAETRTIEHRLAISKRENLTEQVSDALIGHGELAVAESLVDNLSAAISADGFARIGARAPEQPSLRKQLSLREDLPLQTAQDILGYLKPDDAKKLLALMDIDGTAELTALLERATPELIAERGAKARQRIAVRSLMNDVTAGKLSLNAAVGQMVEGGEVHDLSLGLSLASGLPELQVANAIVAVRMEPLAVICKALDIALATYIAADALRTGSVNLPRTPAETLTLNYGRLTVEAALRSLRFVKVRNTAATAG